MIKIFEQKQEKDPVVYVNLVEGASILHLLVVRENGDPLYAGRLLALKEGPSGIYIELIPNRDPAIGIDTSGPNQTIRIQEAL